MVVFRIITLVLAILQVLFTAFTGMVGAFADLTLAQLIAAGTLNGDWWLPLMFSVIPSMGLAYALTLAKHRPKSSSHPEA